MTAVQKELYELLKLFDRICREHKIEYFLTGGSALGAIRHNGFISWDDDIDVGITKTMWDRLKPILQEELPEGIVLVCNEDYPTYRNPVVRIVDTRSARITRAALGDGCPKGQFLELFIHYPVPKEAVSDHKREFEVYCELMTPYLCMMQSRFVLLHGLKDDEVGSIDEYFRIKVKYSEPEIENLLSKMEKDIGRFSPEESDFYLLGWGAIGRYYPIGNYSEYRYERFEDMDVPVPVRACNNLRMDFRNEWKDYPKEIDRTAPHLTIGEPGISGDEYMRLIAEEISFDDVNKTRLSMKDTSLRWLKERIYRDKQMLAMRMKLAQDVDRRSKDSAALYRQGKYDEIIDRFDSYIKLKKSLLYYSLEADISRETREIIASSLIMKGRLTDAENVMDLERTQQYSPEGTGFNNDILRLAMTVPVFYDGFPDEAGDMLHGVREDWHGSVAFRKMNARLELAGGAASKCANELFEEFPDDAEAAKLHADSLMLDGRKTEAENLYRQVLEKGNNGMDILDIKKRLSV